MTGVTGSASGVLAHFAANALAEDAVRPHSTRLAELMLDLVGVTVAGVDAKASVAARRLAGGEPPGDATVLGTAAMAGPATAALANATTAHALDFDDVQQPWFGHPSAVVLPAALAIGEQRRVSGHELLCAYYVGLVVGDAIGAVVNTGHYDAGWHPTGTLGSIAAAAAAAVLLGLDEKATRDALGIGAAGASGLRAHFGTATKPLQAGFAARNGVTAAVLAEAGADAASEALDGRYGFADAFGGTDRLDARSIEQALSVARGRSVPRVGLKKYPCCAAAHPAIDAVLQIAARHDIDPAMVAEISCVVDPLAARLLVHHDPQDGNQAKFSLEHCLAAALSAGTVGLAQFTDRSVRDPQTRQLMATVRIDPDTDVASTGDFPATVAVSLRDGSTFSASVTQATGKADHPLTRAVIQEKYAENVRHDERWLAAGDDVLAVGALADVRELTGAMRRAASRVPGHQRAG